MNLLQLASYDLRYASMAMMTYVDDGARRQCAFHVQQAIEKALKYMLVELMQPSEFTHDINLLVSLVESKGGYVPEYIKHTAKRISGWQSKARYERDFRINMNDLEKTFTEAQNYVDYISEYYKLPLVI